MAGVSRDSPNTLISNTRIKIIDLVSEGETALFWPTSGISGANPLCSVLFDDVPVMNGDGSTNWNISGQGFSFLYNSGASGQSPMVGFEKVEAFVPLSFNPRVANPPIAQGPYKTVVTSFNTTQYPDAEGVKITIRFPAVYKIDTTNGSTNGLNIEWGVDVSLNGGPFLPFQQTSVHNLTDFASPSSKCTSPYYNTQVYTLPKTTPRESFYEWKIRVRRISENAMSSNVADEMFVDNIAVVSSFTYSYPMSALVGLEISADQFGTIPNRSYEVKGIKVQVPVGYTPTVYNIHTISVVGDINSGNQNIGTVANTLASVEEIFVGAQVSGPGIPDNTTVIFVDKVGPVFYFSISQNPTGTTSSATITITNPWTDGIWAATYPSVWNGVFSTTRLWTDNPAWIFYDLVTNKRYGLGNYIRAEWLDKWTLYQIARYCDEMVDDGNGGFEPRFTCNVAITQAQDAYTLLNNLVSVFQGMLYFANGRIFPVGPETRDPVFNFTNANVIGGAFNYSDTPRNTRSTVCVVKWIDPTNNYRPTPERLEDINGIGKYGYIEKQITAFACTSRGQAIRAANWLLTVEQLLTETVSFQTDLEGLYLRPGDVFNLYDNFRNNQQQGGRIADINAGRTNITLDRPVTLQAGFTYVLSALVPAANYATGQNITGSDQVGLIRNSQIETRVVSSPAATGYTALDVASAFSSSLFKGSPWILNGSGNTATVFDQATQYKCLITSEPRNGAVEIFGVKYNTGVNYLVNNNYLVEDSPVIVGDTTPPLPPTGFFNSPVTGLLNDNTFFRYTYLYWTDSPSVNTAYYDISGRLGGTAWFDVGHPTTTGITFTPDSPGTYTFRVAAFNANGYGSAYTSGNYVEPGTNPLGTTAPLSGIFISADYNPYSTAPAPLSRYTGFLGATPTFEWNIVTDSDDVETPTAQFISGYRVRLLKVSDNSVLSPDFFISGKENARFQPIENFLSTGNSIKSLRAFVLDVDTVDDYGNIHDGSTLTVYNQQPRPPIGSGFVGYNGGVSYNITPAREADVSGVYLWVKNTTSFTPTYDNYTYRSTNLAGFAPASTPQGSSLYTWYSLVDTYGPSGSILANGDYNAPIYGPISGNPNQVIGDLFSIWNPTISGTFALVTGLTYTSATGSNAFAASINGLIAAVSGVYSKIAIVAEALVSGDAPGGANNAVLARYGFKLDANGKVVSMVATASTFPGEQSNIVFGGADLQSDTYSAGVTGWQIRHGGSVEFADINARGTLQSYSFSAGSAGWRIKNDGNAEFNNISARGAFTGGAGTSIITMDSRGFVAGDPTQAHVSIGAGTNKGIVQAYKPSNAVASELGYADLGGSTYVGLLSLYNNAGAVKASINGNGLASFGGLVSLNAGATFGGGSSPSTVGTVYNGNVSISLGGGAGTATTGEQFDISLTNRGFSAAPTAQFLTCIDSKYVVACDLTNSTSSNARCNIRSTDGTAIPNTSTPISFLFIS